ncbi:MAG: MBL fold metallo-hydrolase [Rhodothermia bacterium]
MDVVFYGTRGSIPVCDPNFHEFGGDTTCIALETTDDESPHNRVGIIDAGTGIFKLGRDLARSGQGKDLIHIAFTHFHWDHIQGFPFFKPAYDPAQQINILALGAGRGITDLKEIFALQMQTAYFPVQLDNMGAKFSFILHDKTELKQYYSAKMSTIRLNHPGGSYGYRMEAYGKVVVICTDVEYENGVIDENVVEFARGADLLIHDAQYTDEELERFRGWGHSTFNQAMEVAERAEVKLLAMTHHDPEHDDEFLTAVEKNCQDRMQDCFLARQGMRIRI